MKAKAPELKAHPSYAEAFARVMSRIEGALGSERRSRPVVACVAGGAALHFYLGGRVSNDIDAALSARMLLNARDLRVSYADPDGGTRMLYFDTQYNDSLALMHENAQADALPIDVKGVDPRRLEVRLLAPVDLAVSKLSRFAEQDREDIGALARAGLITEKSLRKRAEEALGGYVGNLDRIRTSIELACKDIRPLPVSRKGKPRARRPR